MCFYLRQSEILVNLSVMTLNWVASTFSYYLINFGIEKFPYGTIYINSDGIAVTDIVSVIAAGFLAKFAGLKTSLITSYVICAIGACVTILWGWK